MTRRRLLLAFALSVAAAATPATAPDARADTVVDLGNGDTVNGTFFPATESEVFRFVVPQGAKLTVIAQGKRKKGVKTPKVALVLRDRTFADLTAKPGVRKPIRGGAKVSGLRLSLSGRYTATLTADIAGDYTFQVKWTSPPRPGRKRTDLGPGVTTDTVTFPADAGTKVSFTVAADKGSTSIPRLVNVAAGDLSWTSSTFALPPNASAKSYTKRNVKLGGTGGDYVLTVIDTSVNPGPASVTFAVVPPRVRPRRVNLTRKQTGGSALNNFAKGGVVGTAGGSVGVADPFNPSPIDGAKIEIPAGKLATPTIIVISTGNTLDPPGPAASQGPAVNFGPDGLQFKQGTAGKVFVTIPFDPAPFAGDFAALDIFVKDSKGKVSLVVPKSSYVIDANAGTVGFPVSHFSTYQAFGPAFRRKADLNDDGFDDLVVPASRAGGDLGKVLVFFGRANFVTSQPAAPDVTITGASNEFRFGRDVAVGDVNGDGIADLAVTSNHVDVTSNRRVHVFFGGSSFAPTSPADAGSHADGLGALAETFGDRLLIGDVTGDGKGDLIVAAPGATIDFLREGAVAVFPGATPFVPTSTDELTAIVIKGGAEALGIGQSLATGRLVGDAAPDLVIGAENGQISGPGPGAVFIVPGGAGLVSRAIPPGTVMYFGEVVDDRFGAAVAVADINGDGNDDVFAGAPGFDGDPGNPRPDMGDVYVFLGPTFQGGPAFLAAQRLAFLPEGGEQRGFAIVTGNFGGSSVRDVAFSTPLRDSPAPSSLPDVGGAWTIRGGLQFPAGLQFTTAGQGSGFYGARLLQAADLNGDGRDDLGVTSPNRDGGRGAVEVYFGPGTTLPSFRFVGDVGDRLGDRSTQ